MEDKKNRKILESNQYTGMRKIIGERMKESLLTAPQGSMTTSVDMSASIRLREKYKEKGINLSFSDILSIAVVKAIKEVPIINSIHTGEEIVVFETVNVGLIIQIENGLIVPVLVNAEQKNLVEICAESRDLIEKAQKGDFANIPLDCATISVNNLGIYDIDVTTPFLNIPESTIITIAAIRKTPVVDDNGEICIKPMAVITGTNDHRVYDGGQLAMYLTALKNELQKIDEAEYTKII